MSEAEEDHGGGGNGSEARMTGWMEEGEDG